MAESLSRTTGYSMPALPDGLLLDVGAVLLEFELWPVDADHEQAVVGVLLVPGVDVRAGRSGSCRCRSELDEDYPLAEVLADGDSVRVDEPGRVAISAARGNSASLRSTRSARSSSGPSSGTFFSAATRGSTGALRPGAPASAVARPGSPAPVVGGSARSKPNSRRAMALTIRSSARTSRADWARGIS